MPPRRWCGSADLGGGPARAGVGDGVVGVLEGQAGVDGDRGGDAGGERLAAREVVRAVLVGDGPFAGL
jgi:hypothetical protein